MLVTSLRSQHAEFPIAAGKPQRVARIKRDVCAVAAPGGEDFAFVLDMPDADGVVSCGAGDAGAVGVPCDRAHDAAVIRHVCALLHGARVHECDFAFVEDSADGDRRSIGRERGDIGILG